MEETLQKILDIDPNNNFLKYIVRRVQRSDYRGVHLSQHNRYDLDKVVKILDAIYVVAKEEKVRIPGGDTGQASASLMEVRNKYPEFYEIYQNLKSQDVIKAPDPLRKNLFVDFYRMGLIERYGTSGLILDPFRRARAKSVRLSGEGKKLLDAETFDRHKIFTDGVERLLGDALVDLVSVIDLSDYRRDHLYFQEYTFIFSDGNLTGAEKIDLLGTWRKLTPNKQAQVLSLVKAYCNPANFLGRPKPDVRDYDNWQNETQQLMHLFQATIYFQVNHKNKLFSLNTANTFGIFEKTRKTAPKNEYFATHQVTKKNGYELHHIVPLGYVRNRADYQLIDDYRNLIYIHKNEHKKIKRDHIIFRDQYPEVHFVNRFENSDARTVKNGKNAEFKEALLPDMRRHNKEILKRILQLTLSRGNLPMEARKAKSNWLGRIAQAARSFIGRVKRLSGLSS